MVRPTRSEQFVASEICMIHAVQRCVRVAFLGGIDEKSGTAYSTHRRVVSATNGSVGFGVWHRRFDLRDLEQSHALDHWESPGFRSGLVERRSTGA